MLKAVSFAHAKHANVIVFYLERLVLKLPTVQVATKIYVFTGCDLAHLNIHAFHNSVDICSLVGQVLTI